MLAGPDHQRETEERGQDEREGGDVLELIHVRIIPRHPQATLNEI
jgi:hypothetical protein